MFRNSYLSFYKASNYAAGPILPHSTNIIYSKNSIRQDTDIVMQESRVSDQLGRTCLGNLLFTPAEKQIQKLNSNSFNN